MFAELSEAGLSVVCLEKGRWHSPFEERKNDLLNQRNPSLGIAYGPDEERNPRVFVDLAGRARTVRARDGAYHANASSAKNAPTLSKWRFMTAHVSSGPSSGKQSSRLRLTMARRSRDSAPAMRPRTL